MRLVKLILLISVLLPLVQVSLFAEDFEIPWYTVDGGGQTFAVGGTFELGGTLGQPDAAAMAGGPYQLIGGFWPVVNVCYCLGDMTHDGLKDGRDVQKFTDCLLADGNCSCADVDQVNGVTVNDVTAFVNDLLVGQPCP